MTIPVSLNPISLSGSNLNTAGTNINANSVAIQTGFSSALNIAGDQMHGNLDMNSNQILNLPAPATVNSPARLIDVVSNPTITVPAVGTSGAVVGLLSSNLTFSGNDTFTGTNSFGALTATTITAPTVNTNTLTTTTINATSITTTTFSASSAVLSGSLTAGSTVITGNATITGSLSVTNQLGSLSTLRYKLAGTSPGANTYTWYVDGTNGSDSNSMSSAMVASASSAAWKTPQHAMDQLSSNIDANQQNIVIQVNDASAQTTTLNLKPIIGVYDFWPNVPLLLSGNTSAPVVWNSAGNITIHSLGVSGWTIQGFSFTTANAAVFESEVLGRIYIGNNTYAGTATTATFESIYGGWLEFVGTTQTYNVSNTAYCLYAVFGGTILFAGNVAWNMATVNTYLAFVNADANSQIIIAGGSYSGSGATSSSGPTYLVSHNSYLNTGGVPSGTGGGTNLVGRTIGTTSSGGQVV